MIEASLAYSVTSICMLSHCDLITYCSFHLFNFCLSWKGQSLIQNIKGIRGQMLQKGDSHLICYISMVTNKDRTF